MVLEKNTSINLCVLETGIPPVIDLIKKHRKTFLQSKIEFADPEQPFNFVYAMCRYENTPDYRLLSNELRQNGELNSSDKISNFLRERSANANKFNTYVSDFNPSLSVHKVYSTDMYVPDFHRTAFTRVRLMSHNLQVETGRWSRIPAHLRTCPRDDTSVQTEEHELISCPLSERCRNRYRMLDFRNINVLMNEQNLIVHDVLCVYV